MVSVARLLPAALVALAGYAVYGYQAPCSEPVRYRLGNLDSRFGLTPAEVVSLLQQAEDVWEKTARPGLFEYDANGELAVNFIYDNRQRIAQENAYRKKSVRKYGRGAKHLRARYEKVKARYERERRAFVALQASHEARVKRHNQNVEMWNRRGGAPPGEFAAIRQEAGALESAVEAVEAKRVAVNALAEHANRLSDRHNALAKSLNDEIDTINTTAGREFKQGLFTRNASGVRIDVYEFVSHEDLVHVLAHELGHAIGLGHNENPESIMYGLNSTRTATPTREDLAALAAVCGG